MRRRALTSVFASLAVAVVVIFLVRAQRRSTRYDGAPTNAAASAPGPSAPSAPPLAQRWPRWGSPPGSAAVHHAPNGAFEGRVVSGRDGSAVPVAQLTFARAEEAASVAAQADGAFRFDARVPGRWSLAAVTAPGFLPFAPRWGSSPVSLEARPGEVMRGITITLAPEVVYEGRVIDQGGMPVTGAVVRILGETAAEAVVPLREQFTSDDDGRFTFAAPEGSVLEARKAGFAPARAPLDRSARLSGRLVLRLRAPGAASLAIEGTVENWEGAPMPGATVTALERATRDQTITRAGAEGRFRLDGLTAGPWTLMAERSGAAPGFMVAEAGATDIRLRMMAGGRLRGRVRDGRTSLPVAPFTVLVQSITSRSFSVVDPDGRYAIDDLAPGRAVLSVVAPGYAPSAEVRVRVPAPDAPPGVVDFDLNVGGHLSGIVSSRGSKKPIAGASVEVEGMPTTLGLAVRVEAASGPQGRFELVGVPEEAMSLFASAPGHHARVLSVAGVPGGTTSGPVEIELTPIADGEQASVEVAGIGAILAKQGRTLRIVQVIPGGGAAEVGLAPDDEVVTIDGTSVETMSMASAVPLLRGPEGTTVVLAIIKAGTAAAPIVVPVPRRLVRG